MQQLHQIENILKQLNQRSAKLQPGAVQRLQEIQKRFDTVSQSLAQAATAAQTKQSPAGTNQAAALAKQNAKAAMNADASLARRDHEMTTLVQSIVKANRKHRHQSHQSVSQPRFLSTSPVRQSVVVNDGSLPAEFSGGSGTDFVGTSGESVDPFQSPYAVTFTVDQNWSVDEVYSDSDDYASPINILDTTKNNPIDSIRISGSSVLPQDPITPPTSSLTTDTDPDVIQLPPPVPHFSRRHETIADPGQVQPKDELPIFGSIWFRRSAPKKETAAIVKQILDKVPPVAPATLQFTASGRSKAEAHLITTQIAWELSRKIEGNVLLVDADFITREISRQLDNVYLPGLGEILNLNQSSEDLIRPTGVEKLFWLPSGMTDVSYRKTEGGRWFEISAQLKRQFQYICIYSGAAEETVTNTWGRFCDFSFLIASMEDDLGQPTRDLVEHLRNQDCRIAGLITVD